MNFQETVHLPTSAPILSEGCSRKLNGFYLTQRRLICRILEYTTIIPVAYLYCHVNKLPVSKPIRR